MLLCTLVLFEPKLNVEAAVQKTSTRARLSRSMRSAHYWPRGTTFTYIESDKYYNLMRYIFWLKFTYIEIILHHSNIIKKRKFVSVFVCFIVTFLCRNSSKEWSEVWNRDSLYPKLPNILLVYNDRISVYSTHKWSTRKKRRVSTIQYKMHSKHKCIFICFKNIVIKFFLVYSRWKSATPPPVVKYVAYYNSMLNLQTFSTSTFLPRPKIQRTPKTK